MKSCILVGNLYVELVSTDYVQFTYTQLTQLTEQISETNSNPKQVDDGGTTDEAEEPPTSDIDTPALSTASSMVSIDKDNIEYPHYKRKLSTSPSDEAETAHKFPRTAYRQAQSKDDNQAYQNDDRKHSSSGTRTNLDNVTTANTRTGLSTIKNHSKISHKVQPGTSRSALASRKLRDKVTSGTYVVQEKRFKSWKEKISDLDPGARFDKGNPRKVLHSRCSTWLLVKEPGDTTRFKQHVETCQAKPVPVGGTLTGMGWLKKNVEASDVGRNTSRESGKDEAKMPCRGVSDMDNPLVDRYLKRTGAGGGGGRSIHAISRERFKKEFKYLTPAEKEVVQVAQRAEWAWRNDHLNLRVHAMNCECFTSSTSLATSLCTKCKHLLVLKAFTDAIRKKMPLDENLKYTNVQYTNPILGHLYAKVKGLRAIIEHKVSDAACFEIYLINYELVECKFYTMHQVCRSSVGWARRKSGLQWLTRGYVYRP